MPALLIKDLPRGLHEQLKRRAVRNHRSVTKEALAILEAAIMEAPPRPTLEQIRRWQVKPKKPLTDAFLKRAKSWGRL